MDREAIAQVRRFNRTVAEGIGALTPRFLGLARPLGEARLLWEIGTDGVEVRALRARLGLDSGYLSRVLRALARDGLVRLRVSLEDRRVRRVSLTSAGLAERAELDRRSDALAAGLLGPLSERQRASLVRAMTEVERLFTASMVRFTIEDPSSSDARWCLEQYFAELAGRFEGGFDPSRCLPAGPADLTPPAGALFIARQRDQAVGCGALTRRGNRTAEIKRMWIAPAARGLGLGRRLLETIEQYARDQGVAALRLETNRALSEAIALYRGSGYVEVEPFNDEPYGHYWFEKRLA